MRQRRVGRGKRFARFGAKAALTVLAGIPTVETTVIAHGPIDYDGGTGRVPRCATFEQPSANQRRGALLLPESQSWTLSLPGSDVFRDSEETAKNERQL